MAQNVIINGVTYSNVPEVDIPTSGGTAKFMDTSDANATGAQIRNGATAYVNGTKVTGSMTEKSAQTYTPTTSDQTINANQYLAGAQTIKGDAKLCTKGADYAIRTGVPCSLTIDDGADIQTAGSDNAIYVNSTLTVKGKLSAVCDSKDRARAIYAGSLSVAEQGELSSTVNAINGYAIQTRSSA